MDLGFWGQLYKESDTGRLLLRQRIPEVCVFRGCRLDAWYHNNANGLVVRRKQNATVEAMLEFFSAPAMSSPEGLQTPVVILRTPSAISDLGAVSPVDGSPAPKVPHAAVLTAGELNELVQSLLAGEPPWGVSPGAREADFWTLQALIEPVDDVRAVSVYSCDASAVERSEIFGRRFHKVYRQDRQLSVPTPEDVAADACLTLSTLRRASLEARTLSIVRFVSRFYGIDFEGLILEFVFDAHNAPVLHACWASTAFGSEPRRRIMPNTLGVSSIKRSSSAVEVPKAYPVPTVNPDADEDLMGAELPTDGGPVDDDCDNFSLGLSSPERGGGELDSPRIKLPPGCLVVRECILLLEVWSGDDFLGEAAFHCDKNTALVDLPLRLRADADRAFGTRVDERKARLAASGRPLGAIVLNLKWVDVDESSAFLRFGPIRSEGLQADPSEALKTRVLLWMKPRGADDFAPVWASKEVQHALNPSWTEIIDVSLPPIPSSLRSNASPARSSAAVNAAAADPPPAVGAAGSAIRQRRPVSARGRLESSFANVSTSSVRGMGGGRIPSRTQSECGFQQVAAAKIRHSPPELQTSVKSPREHVCGAEMSAHWGMSDVDGSMSTYVLACQVAQRLSIKSGSLLHRSALLQQLSGQLQQFHHIQLSWDEQWHRARDLCDGAHAELRRRDTEIEKIKLATRELGQAHQDRLADICSEMCAEIDEYRFQEHVEDDKLMRSQHRLIEQRALEEHLDEQHHGLNSSLAKTHEKFDEVTQSFQRTRDDNTIVMVGHIGMGAGSMPNAGRELSGAQTRAETLTAELGQDRSDLLDLKTHLSKMKADLASETNHASKLEDFVRRVAEGPSASVRRGGGFVMDSTAKREAIGLLQEAAEFGADLEACAVAISPPMPSALRSELHF